MGLGVGAEHRGDRMAAKAGHWMGCCLVALARVLSLLHVG